VAFRRPWPRLAPGPWVLSANACFNPLHSHTRFPQQKKGFAAKKARAAAASPNGVTNGAPWRNKIAETLPSGTFLILGMFLDFLELAELDRSIMFTKVLKTPTQTEA
jgi:hypothetical protein